MKRRGKEKEETEEGVEEEMINDKEERDMDEGETEESVGTEEMKQIKRRVPNQMRRMVN